MNDESVLNKKFAEERQLELVEFIRQHKKATVHELTYAFDVSSATIRNDLRALEDQGLLTRTHGGAMVNRKSRYEEDLQNRRIHNQHEKELIAKVAIELIDDGDTIILDAGTTILELARLLEPKKELTVITNDMDIARLLCDQEEINLVLVGGTVRNRFHCTVGPLAERTLNGLLVDKAFIGANNFDLYKGPSTPVLDQAETKKVMMSIASKSILLCDHSKFGTRSFVPLSRTEDFDIIVTDSVDPEERAYLDQIGVDVLLPG